MDLLCVTANSVRVAHTFGCPWCDSHIDSAFNYQDQDLNEPLFFFGGGGGGTIFFFFPFLKTKFFFFILF